MFYHGRVRRGRRSKRDSETPSRDNVILTVIEKKKELANGKRDYMVFAKER